MMESPYKRMRISPPEILDQDFVPLGGGNDEDDLKNAVEPLVSVEPTGALSGLHTSRKKPGNWGNGARKDPRNARDRPKSQHALIGHEPWMLVRTKYGRRFAHNTVTKESLWRIPYALMPAVYDLERSRKEDEAEAQERERNARWAEEQLNSIRAGNRAKDVAWSSERQQRRRSESLQREDEEAMMAELAAQAEQENDVSLAVTADPTREPKAPRVGDFDSDSEYEYVEVTDDEGEEQAEEDEPMLSAPTVDVREATADEQPVEFTEDDIAYQLAAMGADYNLDPGEYGVDDVEETYESGAEGLPLSAEDTANLFRDLLDDHGISPYTPWDKLISDESPDSIMLDDRYTVLPSMRARKDVWEAWARDRAARLRAEREHTEKLDPRIPYLDFLDHNATPKLYWPEFKRKYRKDAVMADRKLFDKDREKMYRDHIARLKLPEATRKADLIALLKAQPLEVLNRSTSMDALPKELLTSLHFISLPTAVRDSIVQQYITTLPASSITQKPACPA